MIHREEYSHLEEKMGEILSELEQQVLALYLDGQSYNEISEELNRHVKSIDNALQRVKRKLERHLEIDREYDLIVEMLIHLLTVLTCHILGDSL